MSPSRTGPLTLRMMERVGSSKNSTRTCEHHKQNKKAGTEMARPRQLSHFSNSLQEQSEGQRLGHDKGMAHSIFNAQVNTLDTCT